MAVDIIKELVILNDIPPKRFIARGNVTMHISTGARLSSQRIVHGGGSHRRVCGVRRPVQANVMLLTYGTDLSYRNIYLNSVWCKRQFTRTITRSFSPGSGLEPTLKPRAKRGVQ